MESDEIVWRPAPADVETSQLGRFLKDQGLNTLDELREKAAQDPDWFWESVVRMLDWPFVTPYQSVLNRDRGWQWAEWFVGGTSNLALAALDRHVTAGRGDKTAVIEETEAGRIRHLSYRELQVQVDRLAHGLVTLGVEFQDRIALYLPMGVEAVVAMLAAAKLGAVVVPVFSGYGAPALATRIEDSQARVLVTADGFNRRGRTVAMKEAADEALASLSSVRRVLVVSRLDRLVPMQPGRDYRWDEVLNQASDDPFPTRAVPSETPLMLIYTSGTTGRPKGALHTHLGFPLKAAQDLWHAFDLRPEDVFFWYTDMGWMMGPWMVYGGLITGSTLLLYDGTPDYPDPSRLWDLIDRHRVSVFGISPTAIRGLMASGEKPLEGHSLDSLRILGSSGEPWNPDPWMWFFEKVGKRRCPIINYSGGTEISGGILSAFATEPQKPCAFNGPIPGMAADVVDESGAPIRGAVGELIIRAPWTGMTRGFWKSPERYLETYWHRWPDVWVHGDYAMVDEDGFWYIVGRSDDTIKVAGKRLGPAEVESILVSHPSVVEAAAVGVPDPVKGEVLICFVVAREGHTELEAELRDYVAQHMGKALRPERVHRVRELPKTRNGKVVRRVIRAAYTNAATGDLSSVENVDALDAIRTIAEEAQKEC